MRIAKGLPGTGQGGALPAPNISRGAVLQKRNWEPRCGELREKDAAKLQAGKMEEVEIARMRAEFQAAKTRRITLLEAGSSKV